MAFTVAVFTRELVDTRGPRASSMRPNAAGAQGLTLERQRVAADIARQERRSLSREQRGLKRDRPLLSQANRIDEMMTLQVSVSGRLDFRRRFLAIAGPLKQSCFGSQFACAEYPCHAVCHANALPRGLPRGNRGVLTCGEGLGRKPYLALFLMNPKMLAGSTGLEPAASGVTGRRSNQLNYDPLNCWMQIANANWPKCKTATRSLQSAIEWAVQDSNL